MSDLHKAFLKRVKHQEKSLGLSPLLEDSIESPTSLNRVDSDSQLVTNSSEDDVKSKEDEILMDAYHQAIRLTFPIIGTYECSNLGISFQTYYRPPSNSKAPIFVCHHGAGSSSMTFCKLATSLTETYDVGKNGESPGLFVFDMRGHGNSTMPKIVDFSLGSLTKDFEFILKKFLSSHNPQNSIYLIGHSLGGSILTNYIIENPECEYNFKGLVMIDIVEETAVKSLIAMPQYIKNQPKSFPNYQRAIDWHVKHVRLINNTESAKISVPDLLMKTQRGIVWKTNLEQTQPFWESWFTGLSENFVKCNTKNKVAKLLILSGHETLDTNLIIGQMQGKYQLIVFNNSAHTGHFVQEDIPKQLSISLIDFAKRNDSPAEYMKQELGFIPKWGGKINK